MGNQIIESTGTFPCDITLLAPNAVILTKMALEKAGIIKVTPCTTLIIDLRMPLNGKNIITPGASRAPQGTESKLKHLSNVLLYPPMSGMIWPYLDAKDSTRALTSLATSCATFYQQTERIRQKRALGQLLQAMLDDNPLKVSSILNSYPEFLLVKPEVHDIREIESHFTWLRYLTRGESVFSIVQKLLLLDMLKIMLPLYLKQLEDARHVPGAKQAILELEKQWILPDAPAPLEEKKIEEEQEGLRMRYTRDYLLTPLKALAADTTIRVSWEENAEKKLSKAQIKHMSPATVKSLENLRTELLRPKAIQDCINIKQLLIAAYDTYDNHFDALQDWHRRDAFAILVIGFILGLVNPSLGKIYCESLYGVINNEQKISTRADSLFLADGRSFYRAGRDSHLGQGFDFLCNIFGMPATFVGRDAWLVRKLCQANAAESYRLTQQMHQRSLPAAKAKPSRCVIS